MYKLFLCLRYLRKRRIAFFAVAAVCLCVAMVLIVFSVMDGFLRMVKDHSRGLLGDLVMENGTLQGFSFYDDFIEEIETDPVIGPRVKEATPVIISYGVLRFPQRQTTFAVQIVGIRLEETYRVNDFKQGLFYEQYYPGSTHLGSTKVPMYGRNKNDEYVLPSDLESAFKQWRANASPEERAEVPIEEDLRYERPGYYRPITPEIQMEQGSAMPGWFDEAHKGIIIGTDLCARRTKDGSYNRYHFRGEKVVLTMVPMSDVGTIRDATGMPWEFFRYIDDCRTGVYEIDSKSVYVDFDSLQPILQMHETEEVIDVLDDGTPVTRPIPARTTQIQIKLTEEVDGVPVDPIATRDLIAERWLEFARSRLDQVRAPMLQLDVEVKTWEEKQANFIGAVEKEKYLVTILFGIISLVAVLLVGCIFYMIVQQKTRDIGIIKSVGATAAGVAQIFLAYGAAVGVVGGAIGIVIGAIFVRYINEIQELLIKIHPSAQIWNPEVYSFDRIPSHVDVGDAIVIYVIAIGASMLGSLIAAWRAARVWPVEALRYE